MDGRELTFAGLAHQQAAQAKKNQARLAANYIPKQASGFVTIDLAERFARRSMEQVHQPRIIFLLEMVQGAPDHPMRGQFTAEGGKLSALALL